jgi:hypothetical protein
MGWGIGGGELLGNRVGGVDVEGAESEGENPMPFHSAQKSLDFQGRVAIEIPFRKKFRGIDSERFPLFRVKKCSFSEIPGVSE